MRCTYCGISRSYYASSEHSNRQNCYMNNCNNNDCNDCSYCNNNYHNFQPCYIYYVNNCYKCIKNRLKKRKTKQHFPVLIGNSNEFRFDSL